MGTKGSYSGGGGAAGDALRTDVGDWFAGFPGMGAGGGASAHRSLATDGRMPRVVRR